MRYNVKYFYKSLRYGIIITSYMISTLIGMTIPSASDDVMTYNKCMSLIDSNPEKAFDIAIEWRDFGGGNPSLHCVAAALLSLGHYLEAATRLEYLADQPTDNGELRASLLQQSAQAWVLADNNQRAFANLSAAIDMSNNSPKLFLERAVVQANMELFPGAINDLSKCIKLDPLSADAYTFRGSAYRHIDDLDKALFDLNHALALEPEHLEARLERGIVHRLNDDIILAKKDWMYILKEVPNSHISDLVRKNIQLLEVKAD